MARTPALGILAELPRSFPFLELPPSPRDKAGSRLSSQGAVETANFHPPRNWLFHTRLQIVRSRSVIRVCFRAKGRTPVIGESSFRSRRGGISIGKTFMR